jgi:deoxyribodipyrimidine photo-lyase
MSPPSPNILWLRQDLRLSDNPALYYAAKDDSPLIIVYIHDSSQQAWSMGKASKWWLHQSLIALDASLKKRYQLPLLFLQGDPLTVLNRLIQQTNAKAVFCNMCFEPHLFKRDIQIESALAAQNIALHKYNASLLLAPWLYHNQAKKPFKVFTPFWKSLQKRMLREIYPIPKSLISYKVEGCLLEDFQLLSSVPWYEKLEKYWQPGEKSAKQKLKSFLYGHAKNYALKRDLPGFEGTSKLSPHLHFGEIGPIQVWHAVQYFLEENPSQSTSLLKFLSELAWREFAYHLLHYHPAIPDEPFKPAFNQLPWENSSAFLKKWQQGQTGYPIVDAGMKELWETGWMHNRVRMIVASFLTKHLLQPWQKGEAWFWDTLVDADLANNAVSWQWVAGCGPDAAPYFRIFNPVLQGEKFDAEGAYIKKWLPALKHLSPEYIHAPWEAPAECLVQAGIILGKTYPYPMIDHAQARNRVLENVKRLKNQ